GLEMLEKCREITDDFVSIIITGHGDHERAVQALQLGVFNYLRKPISLEELVIAVGKGIEFLHLRRGLAARRRELEIETALKEQYAQNLERMVEERTEELRESEAQYRGIFESASDAFLIFNPGGEIVEANPAACEMYGYPYEELIGLSGKDIVHPDYYHLFEDFKKQVQSSRPFDTESVDVRKDGSTFNVEVHGAPFNYRGKLHLLAVVSDITERVRAEQEISQRAARLTAINRISAAVSTLDLNEILNTITQQMVELFAVEHSGVLMFDEKKEWGYVLAEHPDWGATAERFQVKGYLAAERIIADREPLVIEDTWQDPLMASVRETMHRLDIRSMLIVPLIVRGEVIGSIGLDAVGRQRRFAAEEVALTQTIANQVSMAIENARLFEAEQRRRQEAETLREAALALTTSLERNQVIERILIQLREVVPYDSASVQLLHDDHLEIIGGHGFPNLEELLGVTFDLTAKNNPNREVIHTRAPFILADAPAVYSEFRREPHAQAGIRSWLGVPMLIGEQPIGMIALDKREPGFYTPEHARLALAFAAQAAVAIQNARLFEAEQQQTEELEALVEVGRAVSSTLDLNQVLNAIAAHATTISRSDEGGVFELDKAEGVLRITASCNASQEFVRAVNEAGVRVGEGAVGRAVATGKPVQVVDTETEAGYRFQEIAAIDSIRSVLAVPIFKGEELLGGIVLWRRKPCAFSSHNVALLSGLADQAAIAIENARLYQQARRRAERLAAVNRIAHAASGTLHLDDLMETVYREVVPLFQADAFFVALYDEETDELDFRIRVDEGTREPPERRPVGSGLTGLIVAKKRPLLIRNFEEERERLPWQVMVWGTMKAPASWLGVPMRIGDRVVGVISVQAYRPHAYGEEEQLLLSTIADQVAVAVENARLFEETRRRLTREVRLNELAHTLGGEMGLATLIPRLLPVVAELTGADAATVAILDPEEQVIVYPY
ncbi:MAG TPA: GAF domain-containing protein, partial [Chloroflexi bacterium]|nr:GAF domain-containing protein [Chloroflexota bacterium]